MRPAPVAAPPCSPAAESRIELTAPRRTAADYEAFVTGLYCDTARTGLDQCGRTREPNRTTIAKLRVWYLRQGVYR
jgi:hypothetical protein